MEDHLKNQDRLDQEWEALAAYQADPCSTSVATDQSNARKNRYSDVLPCESRPLPSSVRCAVLCVCGCVCVRACVCVGGGGEVKYVCLVGWIVGARACLLFLFFTVVIVTLQNWFGRLLFALVFSV